jgi:hypothetical protein
MVLGRAIY